MTENDKESHNGFSEDDRLKAEQPQPAAASKPYIDASLLNVSPMLRKVHPSIRKVSSDDPNLSQVNDSNEELEKVSFELAETKDKYLRAMADVENQRRRTEREVKDASVYAISKFANDIVGIADSLRRALDTAPPEAKTDTTAAPILEGVEITERALLQVLERYGVKQINAMGEKFDPHQHQAMFEMESDATPGTVVQMMQTGYMLGERVLRPALVGIAKAAKSGTA